MKSGNIKYAKPKSTEQYRQVKALFFEYAESLEFSLGFQDFEEEIADMPGEYAPPDGCILMAYSGENVAGCVALRKLEDDICEMKRLYVRPGFRGLGIGESLSEKIIDEARRIGYKKMRLDTLPSMKEAVSIYKDLGFNVIPPYRFNPFDGALFMELEL